MSILGDLIGEATGGVGRDPSSMVSQVASSIPTRARGKTPSRLLEHLASVQNRSGSIRSAPTGLMNLKDSIEGVPFDVRIPGMSQVIQAVNMAVGIRAMLDELKNLSALGDFSNVLGAAQTGTDITRMTTDQIVGVIQQVGEERVREALGPVTGMMASLMRFR